MNSNDLNLESISDEIANFDEIDEYPSINRLSLIWNYNNPLLTDKGKVHEKDIFTFREGETNRKWSSIINLKNCIIPHNLLPSNSEHNEYIDSNKECKNKILESWNDVSSAKANYTYLKPKAFKFNNEMSSLEILKAMHKSIH